MAEVYNDQPMIEGSWDRRPHGIQGYTHLDAKPSWVSGKKVTGQPGERPISVYTALSELRFVSDDDEDTASTTDTGSCFSPCSPISQIHFAYPEETMTLLTTIESEPQPLDSFLPSPTDSSSQSIPEESARMSPSEQSPSTKDMTSVSPQQPEWAMRRLDGSAISDSKAGRRPLPEVPGQAQSRPLPPRPAGMTTVPGRRGPGRPSYPPPLEFSQGSPRNLLAASRPASDSGTDTWSQSTEEKISTHDSTPRGTPLMHHAPTPSAVTPRTPASHSLLPSVLPPPIPPLHQTLHPSPSSIIPAAVSTTLVSCHTALPALPSGELVSPTSIDLITAAGLKVTGENGEEILFGDLFRYRKVIVIFIRYFWCLFCEDYVRSISNSVTPEILKNKGVDLILIGNGTPGMMRVYKKALKLPFKVYTNQSSQLYDALGLYKTSNVQTEGVREQGGGNYIKRNGPLTNLRVAVREAVVKTVHGGDGHGSERVEQLGGEFVFGPGLKSSFVHKMQNPRGHAPIVEVLEAAGVHVCEKVKAWEPEAAPEEVVDIYITTTASTPELPPTPLSTTTAAELLESEPPTPTIPDEAEWMVHRSEYLMKIKQKREARRRGVAGI